MMKEDRIFDPQKINLYAYVRNNPFKFVDVSGNDLIPANAKSATQLQTDLSATLSKAEYANLTIVAGQNIVIGNAQFQSTSAAYQNAIQAITSSKTMTYYSIAAGSDVTLPNGQTIAWNEAQSGVTVPIDTDSLNTASVINIYVPESGSNPTVGGQNGQLIPFPRAIISSHEIAHGNCGPGQCAVSVENRIRKEQNLLLRSGKDHQSIPTDTVQTSLVALPTVQVTNSTPLQPITTTAPHILTQIQPRQPIPLPTPLKRPDN